MFILKKGHQPGVYVPFRALFLVIIDKIYVGDINHCFLKFAKGLQPLIDVRFWFLLNVLRMN